MVSVLSVPTSLSVIYVLGSSIHFKVTSLSEVAKHFPVIKSTGHFPFHSCHCLLLAFVLSLGMTFWVHVFLAWPIVLLPEFPSLHIQFRSSFPLFKSLHLPTSLYDLETHCLPDISHAPQTQHVETGSHRSPSTPTLKSKNPSSSSCALSFGERSLLPPFHCQVKNLSVSFDSLLPKSCCTAS